jgi:hypothetical protein
MRVQAGGDGDRMEQTACNGKAIASMVMANTNECSEEKVQSAMAI